jgi:hypothetical protein
MKLTEFLRSQWDRASAVLAAVGGAICLYLGWRGVSGSAYPAAQIPYIISGGLSGVFLLGLAGILWLSADLRDEWRKLDDIQETIAATTDDATNSRSDSVRSKAPPAPERAAPPGSRADPDPGTPNDSEGPARTKRKQSTRPALAHTHLDAAEPVQPNGPKRRTTAPNRTSGNH